jgi:hypothetical protein
MLRNFKQREEKIKQMHPVPLNETRNHFRIWISFLINSVKVKGFLSEILFITYKHLSFKIF